MGPEQTRLMDRLFNDPTYKLRNFHVTRGEKPCTAEEICGEINKALDEVESGRAKNLDFKDSYRSTNAFDLIRDQFGLKKPV
jgi:hypothetical protein